MRFQVLGCSGGSMPGRLPTSFLINGTIAVDGGSLTSALGPEDQKNIEHVVLSHAHLDHVGSLPFLLDNRFPSQSHPLVIHGQAETLSDLRTSLFNGRIWPDFTTLRTKKSLAMELRAIEAERTVSIGDLRITPNAMEHPVPCLGFHIADGQSAMYIAGDTGSYRPVKKAIQAQGDVTAIVIEVSWPDRLAHLASVTGHLVPALLKEAWPLHPTARVLVTHIKPFFREEVVAELVALRLDGLVILEDGMSFDV